MTNCEDLGRKDLLENGGACFHAYAEETCVCGQVFCFTCCGATNVHEGGKYTTDFMTCPKCGHDVKENTNE